MLTSTWQVFFFFSFSNITTKSLKLTRCKCKTLGERARAVYNTVATPTPCCNSVTGKSSKFRKICMQDSMEKKNCCICTYKKKKRTLDLLMSECIRVCFICAIIMYLIMHKMLDVCQILPDMQGFSTDLKRDCCVCTLPDWREKIVYPKILFFYQSIGY